MPKRRAKKKKILSFQSRRAERTRLADTGKPWPIYDSLQVESVQDICIAWDKEFGRLRRALQMRARDMPDQFSAEILARIMSGATYLWLRLNFQLDHRMQETKGAHLSDGLVNALMPRLLKLGGYIAEMSQIQAATARQWAITQAKQNELLASQPARPKRVRVKTPAVSQTAVEVQKNGSTAGHPTATSSSIIDGPKAEAVNERAGDLKPSRQSRLESDFDGSPTDS
jgi:hypothetical protein